MSAPASGPAAPTVGVLALQGDVREHLGLLAMLGATGVAVRRAPELDGLDGLIVPGGESSTIGKLAQRFGLLEPLRRRVERGLAVLGTCAGAIVLSRQALHADGRVADQPLLAVMDTVVRRNAFGRQVASFEADLDVAGIPGGPLHAVFIRAPWIEHAGPGVEVLATVAAGGADRIVVARQGRILVAAFHPELAGDVRLHRRFLSMIREG